MNRQLSSIVNTSTKSGPDSSSVMQVIMHLTVSSLLLKTNAALLITRLSTAKESFTEYFKQQTFYRIF